MPDLGAPISYLVLAEGTPVYASDGTTKVATVRRVLADEAADIFDGIVLAVDGPDRFVDAPEAGRLYERGVVLGLTAAEARALPEHTASPLVERIDPDTLGGSGSGTPARRTGAA
jgi:hypothetical protein